MSSSETTRGNPNVPREDKPAASTPANPQDPYGTWLDRMQRARARHAAITKNLHTWSNYKNWAEQVKDSWETEQKKK
ncbi:MAG TPA: hypothetical protein VMG11_03710 [Steroidobacteraceae bacterium]|nr:hypothetical protein [Steroidobacteraceae bacterium]